MQTNTHALEMLGDGENHVARFHDTRSRDEDQRVMIADFNIADVDGHSVVE